MAKPRARPASTVRSAKTGRGAINVEVLAERIVDSLPPRFTTRKRMFGGIAFMRRGNMLCHASQHGLMVRVGVAAEPRALSKPYAERCSVGKREMPGFIIVQPEGWMTKRELTAWLAMARAYVEPMPAKPEKTKTAAKPEKSIKSGKGASSRA